MAKRSTPCLTFPAPTVASACGQEPPRATCFSDVSVTVGRSQLELTRLSVAPKRASGLAPLEPPSLESQLWLVAIVVVGVAVPMLSTALGLYDRIEDWGKLVHALDGACATALFGLLFLGWRDLAQIDVTDELAALLAMCVGIFFGVMWEIVEFVRDWVAYSDLQKSNTDTMTDLLCNDVACIVAAVLVVRLYAHVTSAADRKQLGETAEWLVDGPSRLLDRHGLTLTVIAAGCIAAAVAGLWFAGRPVPGLSIP